MASIKSNPQVEVESPEDYAPEISAKDELYEIADRLRVADEQEKSAKAEKDVVRGPFLELISEVVREEVELIRQVVVVANEELERFGFDYDKWRAAKFPEWNVVAVSRHSDTETSIALEENDAFKKYEFVHSGYKFGRTVRMTGRSFDVDGFLERVEGIKLASLHKALLATVTEKTVVVKEFDEGKAMKLMADKPETVAIFQEFINPGTPQISLLPIKPVKETEE